MMHNNFFIAELNKDNNIKIDDSNDVPAGSSEKFAREEVRKLNENAEEIRRFKEHVRKIEKQDEIKK
ncbi:MAG: hypothetical protein WC120_01120 [Parcubacteria group bacterium]